MVRRALRIKNVRIYGLAESLVASGYPKSVGNVPTFHRDEFIFSGETGLDLESKHFIRGTKLGKAKIGSGHDCYLKGIIVQADVFYTQYWSMHFQRYHFADIVSSQSKMHKIIEMGVNVNNSYNVLPSIIEIINNMIADFKATTDQEEKTRIFKQIMANMPMGLQLWMRITLNYLQLKTIYNQRYSSDANRLEDWAIFCEWCESLPYFRELCLSSRGQ